MVPSVPSGKPAKARIASGQTVAVPVRHGGIPPSVRKYKRVAATTFPTDERVSGSYGGYGDAANDGEVSEPRVQVVERVVEVPATQFAANPYASGTVPGSG